MNFTLLSEMPAFFTDVLGFDLRAAGVLCIFPYLALFISAIIFGKYFSYLEQHSSWSTTDVRRAAQFVAYFCSGIGLILCGYATTTMGAYACMILTLVGLYFFIELVLFLSVHLFFFRVMFYSAYAIFYMLFLLHIVFLRC